MKKYVYLLLLYFVPFGTNVVSAASFNMPDIESVNIEYLSPSEDDRDIRTTNIEIQYSFPDLGWQGLSANWGVLATYASGEITQLEGSLDQGNLREVTYKSSAFGIGPGASINFQLWREDRVSFHLNGSVNFIIYNKRFPAGGEYYNFMWRGGPSFKYYMDDSISVDIGYHWAHVSNGQGLTAKNPSYDANGIILRISGYF